MRALPGRTATHFQSNGQKYQRPACSNLGSSSGLIFIVEAKARREGGRSRGVRLARRGAPTILPPLPHHPSRSSLLSSSSRYLKSLYPSRTVSTGTLASRALALSVPLLRQGLGHAASVLLLLVSQRPLRRQVDDSMLRRLTCSDSSFTDAVMIKEEVYTWRESFRSLARASHSSDSLRRLTRPVCPYRPSSPQRFGSSCAPTWCIEFKSMHSLIRHSGSW